MPAPLIGVTTYRNTSSYGFTQFSVSEAYTSSLANAGACPLLIPLGLPESTLTDLLARLDGILFTGGGDVQPDRYGSLPHPLVDGVDTDRDRIELYLFNQVIQAGMPFMGICRGIQVINVAMGGSLYEDILDQRPDSLHHQYHPGWPRDYLAHNVQVEEDSRLADILNVTNVQVNSLHHQGIQKLAPGLKPTAYAPDGLIEAFEIPDYSFGLAVQWHPEWLQAHQPMKSLFRAFTTAASDAR